MERTRRALTAAVLATAVASLIGCPAPGGVKNAARTPTPTRPGVKASAAPASAAPGTDLAQGVVQLTGKAKVIADPGAGLISDQGGGLVSNNGGGLISDRGGSLISDQGAGVISNNGGRIISNNGSTMVAPYALRQAGSLATFALADAEVTFTDAAGQPVRDAAGRPIVATTDAQGGYAVRLERPAGNLVARIRLANGGELAAIVVPGGASELALDLDTASTLGATYVLARFVKGDQRVLDRLPRPEAERLDGELDAVRRFLAAAPRYRADEMIAATEALRTRVPTVDRAVEDVKALLLGQAQLGNGRRGTEVPLAGPLGLVVPNEGGLLIGEGFLGRVRRLAPDGTLTTIADAGNGEVKRNIIRLKDLAQAADGTLYANSDTTGLYRIRAGVMDRLPTEAAANGGREVLPWSLAVGADGTLYVGEFVWASSGTPRLVAYAPDGTSKVLDADPARTSGRLAGLAVAPDGAIWFAHEDGAGNATVHRWRDGAATKLATFEDGAGAMGGPGGSDLALGPDGTVYLARPGAGKVVAIAPDGTSRPVAGAGGPAATAALRAPRSLATAPDGTLYVADGTTALVHALRSDGAFEVVAGTDALDESGETTAFAINQPTAVAFDDAGDLLVVESGSSRVRRFRAGALEVVAGSEVGYAGDGGPATQAKLGTATAIAHRAGSTWVGETVLRGGRIRAITPAGIISTLAGLAGDGADYLPGPEIPVAGRGIPSIASLAVDAQGRLISSSAGGTHQVLRYTPGSGGGTVRALAGQPRFDGPEVYGPETYLTQDETDAAGLLGFPAGVAIGPGGEPYFAEVVTCRVMKIVDADGPGPARLERVAGRSFPEMVAGAGDAETVAPDGGKATAGNLVFPTAVAFDRAGNLYVAEAGTIHVAGLGTVGDTGGTGANFGEAAIAALGMPKIAGRVRKVAPDGTITTVAGRGSRFFPGDAGDDALILPFALAVSPDGRLAIADVGANLIRILPAGSY